MCRAEGDKQSEAKCEARLKICSIFVSFMTVNVLCDEALYEVW
jgi:hypothetical protein